MVRILFTGDPVAQQRCRIFTRGNRVCSFDPQTIYKNTLKGKAQDQLDDYNANHTEEWQKPSHPRITFWFFMPIPKSMPKKDREVAENELLRHDKKPDVDNLVKLYLDVLTGSVIQDDNAVEIKRATKVYSLNPRTLIFIEPGSRILTMHEKYEE